MVEINNLTQSRANEVLVKTAAENVLKGEGFKVTAYISIAFVGPGRMRKLNKTYRGKNKTTDILSFPESKVAFGKFKIGKLEKTQGLGEMVICLREVNKNAKKFNVSSEKELARVVIHGALHLLDFDHEKDSGEMFKKELLYLENTPI